MAIQYSLKGVTVINGIGQMEIKYGNPLISAANVIESTLIEYKQN